jgi:hypothetical protein
MISEVKQEIINKLIRILSLFSPQKNCAALPCLNHYDNTKALNASETSNVKEWLNGQETVTATSIYWGKCYHGEDN